MNDHEFDWFEIFIIAFAVTAIYLIIFCTGCAHSRTSVTATATQGKPATARVEWSCQQ